MDYRLVFDLHTSQANLASYYLLAPGVFLFIAGLVTLVRKKRLTNPFRKTPPMPARLPYILLALGAVWVQFAGLLMYAQYNYLDKAISTGKVSVAEGKVVQFRPASLTSINEGFCISGSETCFSYSGYAATLGFHQTQNSGGPIKSGLPVRVTYKGDALGTNTIVKLEVATEKAALVQFPNPNLPPPEAALSPAR